MMMMMMVIIITTMCAKQPCTLVHVIKNILLLLLHAFITLSQHVYYALSREGLRIYHFAAIAIERPRITGASETSAM